MIFGKNAGLMLKYQKAKAKMVEYDVSKQEYRKRLIFRYDRKNPRLLFSSRSTLTVHI